MFDLTRPLDDKAQQMFISRGKKNEKDLDNPMQETNLDYLTRWMAALRNLNSESRIKTSSQPKTIFVFTKPDQLCDTELKLKQLEVIDAIEKRLKRIGCELIIVVKYMYD